MRQRWKPEGPRQEGSVHDGAATPETAGAEIRSAWDVRDKSDACLDCLARLLS
jgi:hypothetical protein